MFSGNIVRNLTVNFNKIVKANMTHRNKSKFIYLILTLLLPNFYIGLDIPLLFPYSIRHLPC